VERAKDKLSVAYTDCDMSNAYSRKEDIADCWVKGYLCSRYWVEYP